MNPISRRTMLRGIGAAVSLPLLEIMSPPVSSAAEASQRTRRMCYLYFPNGVSERSWHPSEVGRNGKLLKLNQWMQPLEPFKQDIVIPRRMWTPRGNGHGAGTATWLTGNGYDERTIDAGGSSVDQLAAKHFGGQTLLPSLELSMSGEGSFSNSLCRNSISWTSSNIPAPREVEPRVVFDRMFRTKTGRLSDQSVIDQVLEDARAMRLKGSAADKQKIDEYLDSLRSIERRISFAGKQAARAQENPELSRHLIRPQPGFPEDHAEYMRVMFDLIVMAFWSDATRICTFMLDHGQSNRYFNFIEGVRGTWHALSHWKDASGKTEDDDGMTSWRNPDEKKAMYNMVTRWHHEQFAYFLKRLKSIREPAGGTLLENSMILYGSNLADGHEHSAKNLPLIVAGGGGGTIKQGREVQFGRDTTLSNLHLSMLQTIGVRIDRFGDSTGPMEQLFR